MRISYFKRLAGLAISIVVFNSVLGCNHVFLQPTQVRYPYVDVLKIPHEEFQFRTRDGLALSAWRFPISQNLTQPKALVVQFHGNGENLSSHFMSVQWLGQYGYEIVSFDYRGYGASSGSRDLRGTFHDAQDALTFFNSEAKLRDIPLIVIGQSLGGSLLLRVLQTTAASQLKACIIDSSFYSFREIANSKLNLFTLTKILKLFTSIVVTDVFSPSQDMEALPEIPYLYFHSEVDPVVPLEQGLKLFASTPSHNKKFFEVKTTGHVTAFAKDKDFSLRTTLLTELDTLLTKPETNHTIKN